MKLFEVGGHNVIRNTVQKNSSNPRYLNSFEVGEISNTVKKKFALIFRLCLDGHSILLWTGSVGTAGTIY